VKTMAVSQFKAHALRVVDRVAHSKECIVITKRGKPLAQVAPYRPLSGRPIPGKLSEAFVFEKDIVSPLDEAPWEANR
jgi:prevent-host-death family protein